MINFVDISQFASGPQTFVEEADTERKTTRRGACGCAVKTLWSLVSKTVDRSPAALNSSASYSLVILEAKSSNLDLTRKAKPVPRDSNENTASSCQVWQSDVNPIPSAGKPAAGTTKNPIAVGTRLSHHTMKISPNYVGHLEKVYSNVRRKIGRQPEDDMPELDVNMMIMGIFMSATMKAVVHFR